MQNDENAENVKLSAEHLNKLHEEYCREREKLHDAALETGGRYDRAVLTISTGALGVSIVFVEKLAPNPALYTAPALIVGWLLLLASVVFQLLALEGSQTATNEQIRILDRQYGAIFKHETAANYEHLYEQAENKAVKRVTLFNSISLWALVAGIVSILVFSSINITI
jgi:hypothetical protein